MKRLVSIFLTALLVTAAAQAPQGGLLSIRADELREKVFHLASPAMKGRGNGAPELRLAAEYIAEVFRKNRVRPAGDSGGYLQNFRLFRAQLGSGNAFQAAGRDYKVGTDYIPHFLSPNKDVEGPLVFVGYGISSPQRRFDELAGVDLRGKIAVVLDLNPRVEDPSFVFTRTDLGEAASVLTKARNAAKAGAIGLVVLQNSRIRNINVEESASTFRPEYPLRDVPMGVVEDLRNPTIPVVYVSESAARRIVPSLPDVQRRIDETLRPQFMDLKSRASLKVDVRRVSFPAQNVVGLIEGRDARLRREVIVLGAHYDHDGEYGGQIWPGADDNASGTAGLLELAEAFGNGAMAPARSVLLCAFAGEEKGELGSQHFADHPPVPIDRIVAMLQMDMIGRNEEHAANRDLLLERETSAQNANRVNLIGATLSPDLRRTMELVNRQIGLDLMFRYDDTPEHLLRRSDQWAFLQKGIPALFVHTGEHPDYHRPSDTPDKILYQKMEKIVRLVYLATESIGNATSRPAFVNE